MARQNRVTPFGKIVAEKITCEFMGNRGVLHDDQGHIVRLWNGKLWITCLTEFKDRPRRPLAEPGHYTVLFFFDEATALAAGPRPCGECRKKSYSDFVRCLVRGDQNWGLGDRPTSIQIDRLLHAHRVRRDGERVLWRQPVGNLPDGVTFVNPDDSETAILKWKGRFLVWTKAGYKIRTPILSDSDVDVITPQPTVAALTAGYVPQVDSTAESE